MQELSNLSDLQLRILRWSLRHFLEIGEPFKDIEDALNVSQQEAERFIVSFVQYINDNLTPQSDSYLQMLLSFKDAKDKNNV